MDLCPSMQSTPNPSIRAYHTLNIVFLSIDVTGEATMDFRNVPLEKCRNSVSAVHFDFTKHYTFLVKHLIKYV